MKRLHFVIGLFVLAITIVSCGGNGNSSVSTYADSIYLPEYASGFRILGAEGRSSVIIESVNPWQGADSVVTRLFIARDGEEPPQGFEGQVIEGNARRIVAMSSTHIAMLDVIGETARVVGVSGMDFISNDAVRSRRDSIGDVGYDGNVNYELLLSLQPDIILLYGTNGASGMEPKLKELGIPYVYIGEYLEDSALGKAEWIVAVAEIVGKRDKGIKAFSAIPERYNAIREKAANCLKHSSRPKVMINLPYGDSWFMAPTGSYLVRLIEDAGGDYIYKKNNSNESRPIDLEEAFMLVSASDKWINVGQTRSLDELRKNYPKFAATKPVLSGEVYNTTGRVAANGANDYWERGVVEPDVVLRDMVMIFHPELVDSDLVYYEKLK